MEAAPCHVDRFAIGGKVDGGPEPRVGGGHDEVAITLCIRPLQHAHAFELGIGLGKRGPLEMTGSRDPEHLTAPGSVEPGIGMGAAAEKA